MIAAVVLSMSLSGCIVLPLPGKQVPAATSDYKVDPRALCAPNGPVKVGATRDAVHSAIGEKTDAHRATEMYWFYMRAGSFFWLGANSEGGLIGVNKRFVRYELTVDYDSADRVVAHKMKSSQVLDSHTSAGGKYE